MLDYISLLQSTDFVINVDLSCRAFVKVTIVVSLQIHRDTVKPVLSGPVLNGHPLLRGQL